MRLSTSFSLAAATRRHALRPFGMAVRTGGCKLREECPIWSTPEQWGVPAGGEMLTWHFAGGSCRPSAALLCLQGERTLPPVLRSGHGPGEFRIAGLPYQGSWNDGSAFHFTELGRATSQVQVPGNRGSGWAPASKRGNRRMSIDGKGGATVDRVPEQERALPFPDHLGKEPQTRDALDSPCGCSTRSRPNRRTVS